MATKKSKAVKATKHHKAEKKSNMMVHIVQMGFIAALIVIVWALTAIAKAQGF